MTEQREFVFLTIPGQESQDVFDDFAELLPRSLAEVTAP